MRHIGAFPIADELGRPAPQLRFTAVGRGVRTDAVTPAAAFVDLGGRATFVD